MPYKFDTDSLSLIFKKIKSKFVMQEEGKGLSSNDYTATEKSKLAGIAEGATKVTKTSDLANDSGFITSKDIPEGVAASTTAPKMDGTAAVGEEMAFARGDHVHPSDTSRVPVTRTINGKALDKDISLSATDVGAATASDVAKAKQEAIETVLGDITDTSKDTLKEVAEWIESDTTGSAKLITRVDALEKNTVKASDLGTLTETEVETAWNNAE